MTQELCHNVTREAMRQERTSSVGLLGMIFSVPRKGPGKGHFFSFPGHSCLPVLPGPGAVP